MKEVLLITIYEMPNDVSRFKEGKKHEQEMKYVTRQQENKEEIRGSYQQGYRALDSCLIYDEMKQLSLVDVFEILLAAKNFKTTVETNTSHATSCTYFGDALHRCELYRSRWINSPRRLLVTGSSSSAELQL